MLLYRLFILCLLGSSVNAQTDNLRLYDYLEPVREDHIFRSDKYFQWGGSILKDDQGTYHLFYSRWKRSAGFFAWLTHSEIARAESDSPSGPWEFKEVVLQGRSGDHWDAITAHNPKIKFFDGQYYLYYIGTHDGELVLSEDDLMDLAETGYSHPHWSILRNNQRTGIAVSKTLTGPWIRSEKPIIEPSGPITTLTVNPAVSQGTDGIYYMVVKGDKPNEEQFIRNQAVAISKLPEGPFEIQSTPVIDYMDTEDMSIWYDSSRGRFYGAFHAHDYIGLLTSEDGLQWKSSDEPVITNKRIQLQNGDMIFPDRMERPFIYLENNIPQVLSVAVKKDDDAYAVFIPIRIPEFPQPNHRQLAWQEAELGFVFHYDLHVFDNKQYVQSQNRIEPVTDYQIFDPPNLNTDQWIQAVKAAGGTFAIITATHETGFALYQSDVNPYSMKALRWKDGQGDIVRDFVNSCRKYGVKPGIYVGLRWNSLIGVHNFEVQGEGAFQENRQRWYKEMVEGMVTELCTNYGELFEIWFDGGADHPDRGAADVLPIVRRHQPNCLFYHNGQLAEARWGGSESGTVSYPCWSTFPFKATGAGESAQKVISENNFQLLKTGDPQGAYWVPAMSDAPLRGYNGRHEWFWEPGDEAHIYPLEELINMYYQSVGRNSTLIIGLTPDDQGLLPDPDVKRLQEWGAEIQRRFSKPLASTHGMGDSFTIHLNPTTPINHAIIQEDITQGERVRSFRIEGQVDGQWLVLAEGKSIGHKRIEQFEERPVEAVRLQIIEAEREAQIRQFSVFNVKSID